MLVHHYNPETREFLYSDLAKPDPLENPDNNPDGAFLIPGYATTIPPLPPALDGNTVVFKYDASGWEYYRPPQAEIKPPTADDVVKERQRRLALGFYYDFGDERGTHKIGTTDEDLKSWDEVTKLSTAYISSGSPDTQIIIKTDTAACYVTAMEWQLILIAAGEHRQPFFQCSFYLQAMKPIPDDFRNDQYWVESFWTT